MKKIKLFSAALSVLVTVSLLPPVQLAEAVDTSTESTVMTKGLCSLGSFTFLVDEEYATLTNCEKEVAGRIILPSEVMGSPVTRIAEGAFLDCADIESVELGENVSYIGKNAFVGCSSLKSIKIWNEECNIAGSEETLGGSENVRIIGRVSGKKDSIAIEYAKYYEYQFEVFSRDLRGDVNTDGMIDSVDASNVLADYTKYSTSKVVPGEYIMMVDDVNNDGKIDSIDASRILLYYSYASNGGEEEFAFFHDYTFENDFFKFDGSQPYTASLVNSD